jgi:phosphoserine phosphatase
VLRRFLADPTLPAVNLTWVVGDNLNDLALMRLCDRAFVIEPKSTIFANEPSITTIVSFEELLNLLPDHELVAQA